MTCLFIFNNASRAAHYGIGTYVRQLVEGWTACPGVEVSLVDMSSDVEEYTIEDDAQGIRHYRIPSLASDMESEGHCRRAFYFLARHIAAGSGERLVFHFNYFQHFPLAVLLKGQYFDSRILFTVHYLGWCFALKGNKTELRRIMAKDYRLADSTESQIRNGVELEKRFLHFADEVVCLSRDTREFLATDYGVAGDKVHLVYNGMGGDLCRERAAASPASRVVLFVGRLDEIKGLDFLIDAFRRLAGKHPDIRLVVAGDGDFQRYLSRSRDLQGRVSFLGRMEGEELEEVYRSAYIGVMPSFHEQCSYTAIEMMRHGLPWVGTDTTGLAEMLDATPELRVHIAETGWDGEDFTSRLATPMDLLLSDGAAYARAAEAVGRLYASRYKAGAMVEGMRAVVEHAFARPGYTLPAGYLPYMDARMMELVNGCPDIDLDFYGMGGIGVYLWTRALELWDKEEEAYRLAEILEYLIYYMDWLEEACAGGTLPAEVVAMLQSMRQRGFYKTCVEALLEGQPASGVPHGMPSGRTLMQNTLKICNCKI